MYGKENRGGMHVSYNTPLRNSETCLLRLCNSDCVVYANTYAVHSCMASIFLNRCISGKDHIAKMCVSKQNIIWIQSTQIYDIVLENDSCRHHQYLALTHIYVDIHCIILMVLCLFQILSFHLIFKMLEWKYNSCFLSAQVILCLWFTDVITLRN